MSDVISFYGDLGGRRFYYGGGVKASLRVVGGHLRQGKVGGRGGQLLPTLRRSNFKAPAPKQQY